MARADLSLRGTLESAAEHNEVATVVLMRAFDHIQNDDLLKQRILNVVNQLYRDAEDFRELRDQVLGKPPM